MKNAELENNGPDSRAGKTTGADDKMYGHDGS